MALGGYASEKIVFKDLTTGAADDLKTATSIARALVTKYGMSEEIGPIFLGEENDLVFLGKELGMDRDYSEEVASKVDREVSRFLKEAFELAKNILNEHKNALDAIAEKLMKDESIERDEFEKMMAEFGIGNVKK